MFFKKSKALLHYQIFGSEVQGHLVAHTLNSLWYFPKDIALPTFAPNQQLFKLTNYKKGFCYRMKNQ